MIQRMPILGENVHYHDERGKTYAAKVIAVWSSYCANLMIFDDGSGSLGGHTVTVQSVTQATTYGYPSGWSYPEDQPVIGKSATLDLKPFAVETSVDYSKISELQSQAPPVTIPAADAVTADPVVVTTTTIPLPENPNTPTPKA